MTGTARVVLVLRPYSATHDPTSISLVVINLPFHYTRFDYSSHDLTTRTCFHFLYLTTSSAPLRKNFTNLKCLRFKYELDRGLRWLPNTHNYNNAYTYLNLLVRRSKWRNLGTVSHAVSSVHASVGRGRVIGQEGGFRGTRCIIQVALILDSFFTVDSNFADFFLSHSHLHTHHYDTY